MSDDLPQAAAPAAPEPAPVAPTEATVQAPTEAVNPGESPAETTEAPAASTEDPGTDPAAEAKPKVKGGFQKRIDELTRERNELRLRLQMNQPATPPEAPKTPSAPSDEPKIENFQSLEAYQAALRDHYLDLGKQEVKKASEREQAEKQQRAEQERRITEQLAINTQVEKGRMKYADFDTYIAPIAQIVDSSPLLHAYAAQSEHAADVFYQLAKTNPARVLEIAKLNPILAIQELTRLEAKLNAPPPPKPATKAPDPIKPVGARETTPPSLARLAEADDVAKYVALRRSQAAK